jgi:hypothetical protein
MGQIVFDTSVVGAGGRSLIKALKVGLLIQASVVDNLLRLLIGTGYLVGDITKMFRQK